MKEITECLACGAGNNHLLQYLNLGAQPCANSYTKDMESAKRLEKFPLEVMFCDVCSHSQLSVAVDPKIMFEHYLYVSGTTKTYKEHFEEFAYNLSGILEFDDFFVEKILDVGANDLTLASIMQEKINGGYCQVWGLDPAKNLTEDAMLRTGIPTITGFWNMEMAQKFDKYMKFKLITGFNVFAHNLDPFEFLRACRLVLQTDGMAVIQFPNCSETILYQQDVGQIYHEHINYFTKRSFHTLVTRAGFAIAKIEEFPEIHGGSIRYYLKPAKTASIQTWITHVDSKEKEAGLYEYETYKELASDIEINLSALDMEIGRAIRQGYKVIGYGASAKSSTIFNYPNMDYIKDISYVVDDNPLKQGHFCPGSTLAIESPSVLKDEGGNLAIIILAPNFKKEIIERIKKAAPGREIRLICYSPKVTEEELWT